MAENHDCQFQIMAHLCYALGFAYNEENRIYAPRKEKTLLIYQKNNGD